MASPRKTLGFIQASFDSLLPRSPWSRRLGGRPWLDWMLGRLSACTLVENWSLLAPVGVAGSWLETAPTSLPLVPCRGDDVLQAVVDHAEAAGAEYVVRVCADHPLVDAELIDLLIGDAAGSSSDYAAYVTADGKPAVLRRFGLSIEWVGLEALKRCAARAASGDRVDFLAAVRGRPDQFNLRLIPTPSRFEQEAPLARRSLDEQWEDMDDVLEVHLPEDAPSWARVAALLGDER